MHRKFVFQQNDTKIINFDEGVLILEPFFWSNVIFKICFICIKSHDWGNEDCLPQIVTLQNYIMNASLYSCCLCFTKQEQTLYPGEPNNGNFWYVNCDFWDRSGKFWKWHCLRKTAIESKRLHQNEWSWCHIVEKRILYAVMDTAYLFCPSFSWNHWSEVLHSFWATLYFSKLLLLLLLQSASNWEELLWPSG